MFVLTSQKVLSNKGVRLEAKRSAAANESENKGEPCSARSHYFDGGQRKKNPQAQASASERRFTVVENIRSVENDLHDTLCG